MVTGMMGGVGDVAGIEGIAGIRIGVAGIDGVDELEGVCRKVPETPATLELSLRGFFTLVFNVRTNQSTSRCATYLRNKGSWWDLGCVDVSGIGNGWISRCCSLCGDSVTRCKQITGAMITNCFQHRIYEVVKRDRVHSSDRDGRGVEDDGDHIRLDGHGRLDRKLRGNTGGAVHILEFFIL